MAKRAVAAKKPAKPKARKATSTKKRKTTRKTTTRKTTTAGSKEVESEMKRYEKGTAKSGPGGKGGKVKSRKQAIAIGLSKARAKGKKVPKRKST